MTFAGNGTQGGAGTNATVTVGMEETTYGTASAAEIWAGVLKECQFTRECTIFEGRGISNIRTLNAQQLIAERFSFRLTGEVDSGIVLAMALGSISSTTDPTITILRGVEHASPTKTYLPSWTIRRTYEEATDDSVSMLGAVVNSGDFNIDLDGPFTFTLEGVAKAQGTDAATAQTSPATALGSWNTTVYVKDGGSSYSSSGAVDMSPGLKSFGFTVNQNLLIRNEFGGSTPVVIRQPVPGIAEVEVKLTRGFIDDDLWDDLCDGTVHSFQVVCTDGTTTLTMEFDSCFCKNVAHTTNLDSQSEEVATFSCKTMDVDVSDSLTYVSWD